MINRKIAISAVSILSAFALIGGATFAFFSGSADSTGNVFAAGSLTLQLDDNDEVTPATSVTASFGDGTTPLIPGATASGFVSMHNGGSIEMAEVRLSSTQTATSSPDLADKLNITSAKIGTESTCTTTPVDITDSFGTLATLNSAGVDLPSSGLAASETKYLCMTFMLDSGTDDSYQGTSITETFNFVGHQDVSQ